MGSSSSSIHSSDSSRYSKTHRTHRRNPHRPQCRVEEPPPPYVEPTPTHAPQITDTRPPAPRTTEEDVLETLARFDTVFIVDDSSSMRGARWEEAKDALATLAELAGRYDTNGIDIHFLNDEAVGRNLKDSSDIRKLFQTVYPEGATPIGNKLEELLIEYLSVIEPLHNRPAELKKVRPVNFLVITDGYPTDDPESVIVQIARRLDAKYFPMTQVGIQFVQIGNDRSATQYLQELDDGLSNKHKIRDIVDTTLYNGALDGWSILKILLGGINRRVDSRGAAAFSL